MTLDQVCALAIAHEITQFNPDEIHFTSQGLMDFVRQVEAEAFEKAVNAIEQRAEAMSAEDTDSFEAGTNAAITSVRACHKGDTGNE